jgi:hypothetical protein
LEDRELARELVRQARASGMALTGPGGLLARRPVDAGAGSLEEQELKLACELVRQARASGMALTGPGRLLKSVPKLVIETALKEEMSEHLGYDKHAMEGRKCARAKRPTIGTSG